MRKPWAGEQRSKGCSRSKWICTSLIQILKSTENTVPLVQAEFESMCSLEVNMFTQKHLTATTAGSGKAQLLKKASAKGTAALRHGVGECRGNCLVWHELRQRGHRVDLAKREGNRWDELLFAANRTLSDGYTTTLYVDPTSWLITRSRDVRPLHVDVDPHPDYRSSRVFLISGTPMACYLPLISTDTRLGHRQDLGNNKRPLGQVEF